ncbi:2,3-bisphosphoglycerate-independent phosphoglycerate mutase [Natranaerovirga pectinivora]|uniref:2,3-bisphosphoglycerate-independent phosphoglycerate mutase n=1 Tax=Natranaerovirga pectinivora TaxID=682400 RepID=A0A4R3MMM5_9FIRM|nr:cofactor-independent phosphoglycerate mutase [Natranaerovirga pectinivora]TCT13783.1 2,3-bisphosphoglycerate-independent phosphoglycerate mutase [Natranaerovirga pectinivora]
MKYILVLGDGMADEPIEELNGLTPIEAAKTPNVDKLALKSEVGLVNTIPTGMDPGSDTANLSVLGYNPREYYTGRSPLEALSIGVPLKEDDISLRVNLVTLDDTSDYKNKKIIDHSASEITTEEASILLEDLKKAFETEAYKFYCGTSYRHLLVWKEGKLLDFTPPHDILGKEIGEYLSTEGIFSEMMEKSYEILNNHPINIERVKKGLNPANSMWFWGAGTKPILTPFEEKFGVKGAMISAVDLLKGIAIGAEMKVLKVEGATGTLHTNYPGKAKAALDVIKDDCDFVYVHIEAPDECGHQGNLKDKIKAIELIDEKIIGPIVEDLDKSNIDYKLMFLPDHPTPISIRTHTSSPVPYLIYNSTKQVSNTFMYSEKDGERSGNKQEDGYRLMEYFLKN